MSRQTELGRSLHAWRDRTDPAAAGVPAVGVRRAPGLRREELARLAGLSVDYVVRLEQGRATSPSTRVLSALARALRLTTAERDHLYLLAGHQPPGPGHVSDQVPPGVRRLVDQLHAAPLSVYDAAWNLVLWNPLWAALLGEAVGGPGRERNLAWRHFVGLPSRVRRHPEQDDATAAALVSDLRAAMVRYPADGALRSMVDDLRRDRRRFAHLWDSGVVGVHASHTKAVHHPVVGLLELDYDVLAAPGSDLRLVACTAAPGSEAAERLDLLRVLGTQEMAPERT
ncbi:helix-turn-helix transcriptional regulator [Isoptericola haloaureus]|uniref:Helix-turn-helix transcriptional regulator n=1 Tax=Isoptericola haloaureus TaxID=1542902 RepID=A0ABU7Z9Z9_9MICO